MTMTPKYNVYHGIIIIQMYTYATRQNTANNSCSPMKMNAKRTKYATKMGNYCCMLNIESK